MPKSNLPMSRPAKQLGLESFLSPKVPKWEQPASNEQVTVDPPTKPVTAVRSDFSRAPPTVKKGGGLKAAEALSVENFPLDEELVLSSSSCGRPAKRVKTSEPLSTLINSSNAVPAEAALNAQLGDEYTFYPGYLGVEVRSVDQQIKQKPKKVSVAAAPDDGQEESKGEKREGFTLYDWYATLSTQSCRLLYETMIREVSKYIPGKPPGVVYVYQVRSREATVEETVDFLRTCTKTENCTRTGEEWVNWARCTVVKANEGTAGPGNHARWQPCVTGTDGRPLLSGAFASVNRGLSESELAGLLKLVMSGNSASQRRHLKAWVHHVAYLASPRYELRRNEVIPTDVGKGGSVSHKCDQRSCATPEHLEVAPKHIDNMHRQRCVGVTVLLYRSTVVQEIPCIHAGSGPLVNQYNNSCRKVLVTPLAAELVDHVKST